MIMSACKLQIFKEELILYEKGHLFTPVYDIIHARCNIM